MKNIRKVLIAFILVVSLFFVGNYSFSAKEDNTSTDTTRTKETTDDLKQYKAADNNAGEISCTDIFGSKGDSGSLMHILSQVYKIMRIAAVILVIALSMMDFSTAVASSDSDKLKSVTNKFVKRLIVLVVFFLAPSFLALIFDLGFGKGMSCYM